MRTLIIGSGGREHCLAWKVSLSSHVEKIFVIPGNAGTEKIGTNVNIPIDDFSRIVDFVKRESIDLTIVGPEAPLVNGIVDFFEQNNLMIFGPRKELAILEGSKVFAKEILKKFNIPTADFKVFDNPQEAKSYVKKKVHPLVIKADGLALGKGVFVCRTLTESEDAIDKIMVQKIFGEAGNRIVIEDFIKGEEVSILAFIDGKHYKMLVPSQDHKPVYDGDKGPNTGGMGAYAPVELVDAKMLDKIESKIFKPLVEGLYNMGKIYRGILYAGLMISNNEPYVLEFNVRFGDPETQVILPKLKSDFVEIVLATIKGDLDKVRLDWDNNVYLTVVLASGGYPDKYEKNKEILGLDKLANYKDILVFHAGTKLENSRLLTNGGRVLNIVGWGEDIISAQKKVYRVIREIYFENMHYRRDIGNRGLQYIKEKQKMNN